MGFLSGISYNFRGLVLGLRTPKLLFLGFVRFAALFILTVILGSILVLHRQDILSLLWNVPESQWLLWVWHLLSWLLSLLLFGVSALIGFLVSQLLFSVLIMDAMSKITEKMITGGLASSSTESFWHQFAQLIMQEIPRAILPIGLLTILTVASWITPLAPVISVISSCLAVIFLAWDNTDLPEARSLAPFKQRFKFLLNTLPFHFGFGLLFLIPVLNAVLLSFAPVGATLFQIERRKQQGNVPG
ncbi:MAG: EI24 domain-containing protein [Desulfobacterales bacterium]|jgi:CysZ protein|nr:EI24 domain-containing protein [Desulfobacterales bacterium]